jgi:hypothetical protein
MFTGSDPFRHPDTYRSHFLIAVITCNVFR